MPSHVAIHSIGATLISKLLTDNFKIQLQELWMSGNAIGDDGINAIVTVLTNSTIGELWFSSCNITLTGARSLATFLSVNQSIRKLLLDNNPMTTEGARLILQSAVKNGTCQADIRIDKKYSGDSEVLTLMNIMEDRRRMKTNMVGYLCNV